MEVIPESSGASCLFDYVEISEFFDVVWHLAHVDGCRSIIIVTEVHNLCGVESDVFVHKVVGATHLAEEHRVFVGEKIVEVSDIAIGQSILCLTFHESFECFSFSIPI